MPIDLKKLAQDILHEDADLRILAMQTLLRMDRELKEASSDLIGTIRSDLEVAASQELGDCRFFARQCLDHVAKIIPFQKPLETAPTPGKPTGRIVLQPQVMIPPAAHLKTPPATPSESPPSATQAPSLPKPPDFASLAAADPQVQLRTLADISAQKIEEARPFVLSLLQKNPPPEVAALALSTILAIGQPHDVAPLLPFLKHKDGPVRASAVEVVATLAPRDQLALLLAVLCQDPVERVRSDAIKALETLDEQTSFQSLSTMLHSSSIGTRANAAHVLRFLRGDRIIELLWMAARDPSEEVRLRVTQALEFHRHPQVNDLLKRLTKDMDISICEAAYEVLTKRNQTAAAKTDATGEVAKLGPLQGLNSQDIEVRIESLKEIEAKRLTEARPNVIALVTSSEEPILVSQGLSALRVIGNAADGDLLTRFLGHANDRVRANAVEAISCLSPRETVARLLAPMAQDRSNRVRGNVIRALAELGVSGLEPKVEEMLLHPDVSMRLSAVWAASFIKPRASLSLLSKASGDPSPDVRLKLIEMLGKREISQDMAALVRSLTSDPVLDISEQARRLYERIRKKTAEEAGETTLKVEVLPRSPETDGRPRVDVVKTLTPPSQPTAPLGQTKTTSVLPVSQPPDDRQTPSPTDLGGPPSILPSSLGSTRAIDVSSLQGLERLKGKERPSEIPPRTETRTSKPKRTDSSSERSTLRLRRDSDLKPRPKDATVKSPPKEAVQTLRMTMSDVASLVNAAGRDEKAASEDLKGSLDSLYDRLDEKLEEMGRKLYHLLALKSIAEPAFSKVTFQIRRYEEMIKRRAGVSEKSLLDRILFFRPPKKDPAVQQLEYYLAEEYRRLGETAIELTHGLDRCFPDLDLYYESVESILREVKNLKERGNPNGH